MLGPVLALIPSQSQRGIAKLRARANKLGLNVRLVSLTNGKTKSLGSTLLAVYSLPLATPDGSIQRTTPWQLVKGEMNHEIHFADYWDWGGSQLIAGQRWHQPLKAVIDAATGDPLFQQIAAIEHSPRGSQIYWAERGDVDEVDRIYRFLLGLNAFAQEQSATFSWPGIGATVTATVDQDDSGPPGDVS